jgi:hypothetical protein
MLRFCALAWLGGHLFESTKSAAVMAATVSVDFSRGQDRKNQQRHFSNLANTTTVH